MHKMCAKRTLIMFTVNLNVAVVCSSEAQTQHETKDFNF